MCDKIVIPSKKEVEKLLEIAIKDDALHIQTIGKLLGMKFMDLIMPVVEGEPEWNYYGLKEFFSQYEIESSDSLEIALSKIRK